MKVATKYHSVPTEVDGIIFPSKRQASRYAGLKMLLHCKLIADLELEPRFQIVVNGCKICTYVADFRYRDTSNDRVCVEDVKGFRTPVYILKRKLTEALYGIRILEL